MNHMFIGNACRDVVIRTIFKDGTERHVADFTLACSNRRNPELTSFVKFTVWDKLADVCGAYIKKGRKVAVTTDYVRSEAYLSSDGTPKSQLVVDHVDGIEFLDRKTEE